MKRRGVQASVVVQAWVQEVAQVLVLAAVLLQLLVCLKARVVLRVAKKGIEAADADAPLHATTLVVPAIVLTDVVRLHPDLKGRFSSSRTVRMMRTLVDILLVKDFLSNYQRHTR